VIASKVCAFRDDQKATDGECRDGRGKPQNLFPIETHVIGWANILPPISVILPHSKAALEWSSWRHFMPQVASAQVRSF
ncbi:MAG TPA: hypothetical protein VGD97_03265, partial [Lacunisphaera sp.]